MIQIRCRKTIKKQRYAANNTIWSVPREAGKLQIFYYFIIFGLYLVST